MKKVALLLTITLSLVACSSGGSDGGGGNGQTPGGSTVDPINPAAVDFAEYYLPVLKSRTIYPENWVLEEYPGAGEVYARFIDTIVDQNDPYQENIALIRVAGSNLRDSSGLTGIRIVSSQSVEIDGRIGEEVIFDADTPGFDEEFRFMEVSFAYEGFAYGFFYTAERGVFNRNVEILRLMAQYLRFGQVVLDGFSLSSDLESPGNTPIATDGINFLVVSCRESGTTDLVGRFVGSERQRIGSEILIQSGVDTGNTGCRYTRPRITFDGTNYLVSYMTAFNGARSIVAKRITPAGQVLDVTPIHVSSDTPGTDYEAAAVFTGTRHLVAWHHDVPNDVNNEVRGAFVNTDGSVTPSFVIFDGLASLYPNQFADFLSRPEIALGANEILVTLSPRFEREVRQPPRPVYAQLLDLDGTTQLQSPLLVREDNGDNPRYIQVAFDGQLFLVAWIEGLLEESTISAGTFGVYGRQVSTTGQLINGGATTLGQQLVPASSSEPREDLDLTYFDGQYYLLYSQTSFGAERGIYGIRADASSLVPTQWSPVSGTSGMSVDDSIPRLSNPALAHGAMLKLFVIPSRDGTVDAWRLHEDF